MRGELGFDFSGEVNNGAIDEFARVLRRYAVTTVTGDRYAGEFQREGFRRNGINYELADAPKSDLYRHCLASINSKLVELPDDSHLVNQFTSLERRTRSGGRDSIDHPPSPHFHDDLCNACAGLIVLLMARSAAYLRNFDLAYGDGDTEAAKAAWRRWQIMKHIARYG